MVVANLAISFPFVKVDDERILEILGYRFSLPYDLNESQKLVCQGYTTLFIDLSWDRV